jgi:hypothetical protein
VNHREALAHGGAEGFGAVGAGTDVAEMVVAVDASRVAVGEADLNGIITHLRGGLGARFGFEHGQRGRGLGYLAERLLLLSGVVAGGAGTLLAQVRKLVVAGVAVGPSDIHTRAARNMNLEAGWFFSRVRRSGHSLDVALALGFAVAALAWWNRIPVRAGLGVSEECTNALVQLGADDVFEFAGLRVGLGIVDRKSVLEQALGQAVTPDNVACALAARERELHFPVLHLH